MHFLSIKLNYIAERFSNDSEEFCGSKHFSSGSPSERGLGEACLEVENKFRRPPHSWSIILRAVERGELLEAIGNSSPVAGGPTEWA